MIYSCGIKYQGTDALLEVLTVGIDEEETSDDSLCWYNSIISEKKTYQLHVTATPAAAHTYAMEYTLR